MSEVDNYQTKLLARVEEDVNSKNANLEQPFHNLEQYSCMDDLIVSRLETRPTPGLLQIRTINESVSPRFAIQSFRGTVKLIIICLESRKF